MGQFLEGTHGQGAETGILSYHERAISQGRWVRGIRGSSWSDAPQDETPILTCLTEEVESLLTDDLVGTGTNTGMEQQSESNLIRNEYLLKKLRKLERIKVRRGMSSHGYKDSGVGHPPKNRVKKDSEEAMTQDM